MYFVVTPRKSSILELMKGYHLLNRKADCGLTHSNLLILLTFAKPYEMSVL